jgi:hypothetical protein
VADAILWASGGKEPLSSALMAIVHRVVLDDDPDAPAPLVAYDLVELVERVAHHLRSEGPLVALLTNVDHLNHARDAAWYARSMLIAERLPSSRAGARREHEQDGVQAAMELVFRALLISRTSYLAKLYAKGVPAESGAYLYLEPIDEFAARIVRTQVRQALYEQMYGLPRLRSDDELGDERDDDGDEDGGQLLVPPRPTGPGGGPGGGIARPPGEEDRAAADPRRAAARARDEERVVALIALFATAERCLEGKQRSALVAKLLSPRDRQVRPALLLICRHVLDVVPPEVPDDDALAALIDSPSGSSAQRNYNLARSKLLRHARDERQREQWRVVLDALLPRRGRGGESA